MRPRVQALVLWKARQEYITIEGGAGLGFRFQRHGGLMGLRFPGNIVFREEPEGGIVFNVDTGEMRFVEGVARGICRLIEKRRGRDEILSELAARYPEMEAGRLAEDLDDFLSALRAGSMLEDS